MSVCHELNEETGGFPKLIFGRCKNNIKPYNPHLNRVIKPKF